ncbi:MAG TPA: hypothetical protein VN915_07480 [Elusimicrobiota bacterium]|nr:hypothetical protein [Elusimicrobiota bacterium]
MTKIQIKGSEFVDPNLEFSVCSHLQPILEFLEKHGISYDHAVRLYLDKGAGAIRYVKGAIDFDLLESTFEIPAFLDVFRKNKTVFCRRCWCSIVEGRSPDDPAARILGTNY